MSANLITAPTAAPPSAGVQLTNVSKSYAGRPDPVVALRDVSLTLPRGTMTAIMGPSGSGKSTFLQCASGLDRPTSGSVLLGETELSFLGEDARTELRRNRIGFVFQSFNLISSLTAAQNITLPLLLADRTPDKAWVREVVERVGLTQRVNDRPAELSGGQQQRVAIARALVTKPDVIFADEPTGALDSRTGRGVLELLREAADDFSRTVVMVTHDPIAASYADTVVFLADGQIVDSMTSPDVERISERMTRLGS